MEGSVDRIYLRNNSYFIGGWAFKRKDNERLSVDFEFKGGGSLNYKRVPRGDCANGVMVGFEAELDLTTILALTLKQITIIATKDKEEMELELWRDLEIKCKRMIIDRLTADGDTTAIAGHINEYITNNTGSKDSTSKDTTNLNVSVGSKSIDDNVIVGRNGNLFLFKGSNNIHQQYIEKPQIGIAEEWVRIIENRARLAAQLNTSFIQLIIPEKQTVHPEDYPLEIPQKTWLLEEITSNLATSPYYLDVTSNLREAKDNAKPPFKKIDSHFSLTGTVTTLKAILTQLGYDTKFNNDAYIKKICRGDLGEKLFKDGGLREDIDIPLTNYVNGASESFEEIKAVDVAGHIGTERSWVNKNPLIDKKITIFGNSFFERGQDPLGLSYWFARIFRETHFYWSPDFDHLIASKNNSDIILCQTIERFLKFLPKN